jgi:tryptophan synthase beta chain
MTSLRDQHGPFFGDFGGRYMPESLIAAIDELTAEYEAAKADPAFQAEFEALLHSYAGRPSALTEVPRFASTRAGRASSSSARTSTTPAPTRSTT